MITIVTIYRIVLERSSMQGTSCDWVCIVGVIFSLTISHGLVVLVSFLLCIGNRIVIEFPKIVKSIKVWTNEIFFYGITGWCLNGQAICLSNIHKLEFCFDECFLSILLRLILLYWIHQCETGSGCESMAWLIQNGLYPVTDANHFSMANMYMAIEYIHWEWKYCEY